jgi:topoisomerase IA-like protein
MTEELARAFLAEAAAAAAAVEVWNDHPLIRKTGPHGPYVRWNGTTLSVKADESLESIKERLTAKTATPSTGASGPLKTFKDYVIRSGPYGPYILKPALKKPQFVSVPKTVTIDTLTESEVAALYTQGLAAKKRFKKVGTT